MAMTPIRNLTPWFDHRTVAPAAAPAPVAPVASVAAARTDGSQRDVDKEHHHAHGGHDHGHAHPAAHGPTPRPRRNASGKTNRSRRRRRAGPSVEDDEIELPDAEHHADGVASVGFQDEHPDSGNDDNEGDRERSRHERLGHIRGHASEQVEPGSRSARGSSERAGQAVEAFIGTSCGLVAAWRPGDRAALAIQQAKLQLLLAAPDAGRLDTGGLARVAEHLRSRVPPRSGPGNPSLNLMLPLLLLQLQLRRTDDQVDEAIARVQASVWGAR
jgi:hypothetical protein